MEFSSFKKCLIAITFSSLMVLFTSETASADGCWGSSRGGWGSGGSLGGGSGGSWGSRGGLFANAPVRSLLSRIGNRVGNGLSNLGGGIADVLDRRPLRSALFGCNGGSWGSNGGSSGGWGSGGCWGSNGGGYASSGSWSNPGYVSVPAYTPVNTTACCESVAAPLSYSSTVLDSPVVATGGYYDPSSPVSVNQIETSAPVLDYGYYGTQYGPIGAPTDGSIVDGALITGPMMAVPTEAGSSETNPGGVDLPGYYDGNSEETPETPFGAEEDDDDDSAFLPRGKAILSLDVPLEAKVYINDRLTRTKGTRRRYVSRNLAFGEEYRYRVRVVSEVDGKEVEKSRVITMRGGESDQFAFNFDPIVTRVVLSVPDDAKVKIDGKETSTSGAFRSFSTEKLKNGKWKDYSVEVSVVRNGETMTKRKSFDLGAGDFRFFEFQFDQTTAGSIASK